MTELQQVVSHDLTLRNNPYLGQEKKHLQLKDDSWSTIEIPAFDRILEETLRSVETVIDAGCGPGRIFGYLTARGIVESGITGIDPNHQFLVAAQRQFPSARLIHGDIADQELLIEPADLIVCSMVLPHLGSQELEQTMANFSRWTKKGATLVITAPHPISIVNETGSPYNNTGWIIQTTPWGERFPFYQRSISDYINATTRAGFLIETVHEPAVMKSCDNSFFTPYIFIKAIKHEKPARKSSSALRRPVL